MSRLAHIELRAARIAAALVALFFLATFAPLSLFKPLAVKPTTVIQFERLPLNSGEPGKRRVGALTYLQGWRLTSVNPRFGGISAIHVDGRNLIAVNDAGWSIRFPLPAEGEGHGQVRGMVQPLPDGPGRQDVKSQRDAESLAVFGPHAWIAFERQNAVWRYSVGNWRSDADIEPEVMRGWPRNSGSEGIVRLPGGGFLIFSEGAPASDGTKQVALFAGDPALAGTESLALRYRPPEGYRVTDAALLPDGRLLILNRRFTIWEGVSARLVLAQLPVFEPDALIAGEVIAELRRPDLVDNMEALSITREAGRTIVWMASDDNFMPLQQNLLLKFVLGDLPVGRD